jgi:hypothetical protein
LTKLVFILGKTGEHRRISARLDNVDFVSEKGQAMTFPVMVHPFNGQFEARLVGAPEVRVTASTRKEALSALELAIAERLDQGELVALEIRHGGLTQLFGKYRDDPTLREICEAAYQERDADMRQ